MQNHDISISGMESKKRLKMLEKKFNTLKRLSYYLVIFLFFSLMFSLLLASEKAVVKALPSESLAKHEVIVMKLSETEDFIIIPPEIENFRYGTDLLLHPKKEGKYFLIRFYYDEKQKKVIVTTEIIIVGETDIPPEPTPTDFQAIAETLVKVTGKKELAKKFGEMLNSVLVLVNQGKIRDPLHLRETIRYNLRISLGNSYEEIDKAYDEPILKPFLEKYVEEHNIKTLAEHAEMYRKLSEAFKKVGE